MYIGYALNDTDDALLEAIPVRLQGPRIGNEAHAVGVVCNGGTPVTVLVLSRYDWCLPSPREIG